MGRGFAVDAHVPQCARVGRLEAGIRDSRFEIRYRKVVEISGRHSPNPSRPVMTSSSRIPTPQSPIPASPIPNPESRIPALREFALKAVLWLPLAFVIWFWLAPLWVWPAMLLAKQVLLGFWGGL